MKSTLLWITALVVTLASAYYQRRTGPTHPICGELTIGATVVEYCLPRSHGGDGDAAIAIDLPDTEIAGEIAYRRYKSRDEWTTMPMTRQGGRLTAILPHQPPAGKIEYKVFLTSPTAGPLALTDTTVVIRFKGDVPIYYLVPHIALMFMAMLLSTRTGLEALARGGSGLPMAFWTLVLLTLGGLILGPIVQKFAFGKFWTGWPFGQDMTDNKTLVAFVGWLVAVLRLRKRRDAYLGAVVAAVLLLAVYLIPHSVFGSELNYLESDATGAS